MPGANPQPKPASSGSWKFTVGVRLRRDGPPLVRESVSEIDLIDPLSETWLECLLRRGHWDAALEDLDVRLEPIFSKPGEVCSGYAIRLAAAGGHTGRREFTIHSLDDVASRGAQRLLERGLMQKNDVYYFNLVAERSAPAATDTAGNAPPFSGEVRTRPLEPMQVPLGPLLERARTVGPQDEDVVHAFYTEQALTRAERFSRSGARSSPPIETGGVLIGPLCCCPDTGEMFVVVVDALEAVDAEKKEFSLFYSSRTWARIQSLMQAMRARPATRSYRIVGQCHGHSFLPAGGAAPCEVCLKLPVCGRTSVFVSRDDLQWSQAVFRRQPWQLNHIFGLNARGENVQGLFGLRDGRLLERGYRVLPDFEPER